MNGYFQLVNNDKGSFLRLVPPTAGGAPLDIAEVSDYLQEKNIPVTDFKTVAKIVSSYDKECLVPLSNEKAYPQQEMFKLRISQDNMTAVGRFYPASSDGDQLKGAQEIKDDLKFRKVIFGYDDAAINGYLQNRIY